MNSTVADAPKASEPFDFWPWLLPSDCLKTGYDGRAIELLPAIRQRFSGLVDDAVISVRLVAVTPELAVSGWAIQVTEFENEAGKLCERRVDDLGKITQCGGDNYDFSDHPSHEFPAEVIAALLKPGCELTFGDTLGIFIPDRLQRLRQMADVLTDVALHEAQVDREQEVSGVTVQAEHFKRLAILFAQELCGGVDLAGAAKSRLRSMPALLEAQGEVSNVWGELVAECRGASLVNEAMKAQVLDAVFTEFKALPTATQWAYWLLNGDTLLQTGIGDDWAETSNDPTDWTMHDLEACLESAVRSIWREASQEAFDRA
ncbi:hypothetical protein EYS42_03265 [Aquabacterium lacunae]|uniref:Uncharacterized protein n=1 Tax=Aquabacterium lacunae TaxID=2528630 RepID=A0A4Q9H5B0_9BURK|nr:hypothetical protein [Aquabacterium lacunae]TBO34445.1 hypothetical protein EYS42_03265 [Aquabacterium lacunae]